MWKENKNLENIENAVGSWYTRFNENWFHFFVSFFFYNHLFSFLHVHKQRGIQEMNLLHLVLAPWFLYWVRVVFEYRVV